MSPSKVLYSPICIIGRLGLQRVTVEFPSTEISNHKCIPVSVETHHVLLVRIDMVHGHQVPKDWLAFANVLVLV